MEQRPMTIEDFLTAMAANADIYPEFEALPPAQKEYLANINIFQGTAHSYYTDEGKFFGVGGILYVGIGEAWIIVLPKVRAEHKLSLFRTVKNRFVETRDEKNLWRIFAESKISEGFLTHLGFTKAKNMHIWTRTE